MDIFGKILPKTTLILSFLLFSIGDGFSQLPVCPPTPGNCICYGDFESFTSTADLESGVSGSPFLGWGGTADFPPNLGAPSSFHSTQYLEVSTCGTFSPPSGGIGETPIVLPMSCDFKPCDAATLSFSATSFPAAGGFPGVDLKFRFLTVDPISGVVGNDLTTMSAVTNPGLYYEVSVPLDGTGPPNWEDYSVNIVNTTSNTYNYVLIWPSHMPPTSCITIGIDDIVLDITDEFDVSDLPTVFPNEICEDQPCFDIVDSPPGQYTVTGPGVPASPLLDIFGNEHWRFCPTTAGPGVHTITICTASGCCLDTEIEVLAGPSPAIADASFTGCVGEPLLICPMVAAGTSYSYEWATGQTTECITVTPSSTLPFSNMVTATSASGCTTSAIITIDAFPQPDLTVGPDQFICPGESVTLTASTSSSGTIVWFDAASAIVGSGPSIMVAPSSSGATVHPYTAQVTDPSTGCSNSATVIVTVYPEPNVTNALNETICINDGPLTLGSILNCEITNSPDNFFLPEGGFLDPSPGLFAPCDMMPVSYLMTFDPVTAGVGVHVLTYTYTDPSTGCTASATGTIEVLPAPDISPIADFTACQGESISVSTMSTPGLTCVWVVSTPVSSFSVIGTTLSYTANVPGANNITVTCTDANGCSDTETFTIDVIPTINPDILEVPLVCVTDAPFSLVTSPAGGTWTSSIPGFNGNFDPSIFGPGFHDLTYCVNNIGGCPPSCETITIEVDDIPDATFAPTGPFCISDPDQTFIPNTPGGQWSGSVDSDGTFDPGAYGVGTHAVTYTVFGSGTTGTNLVTNGDMEDYSSCITDLSQTANLNNWNVGINGATPDYYNACQTVFPNKDMRVPNNFVGTQDDIAGGQGYCGIHTYLSDWGQPPYPLSTPTTPNVNLYREFIQHQLSQPLVAGETYRFKFYVSMAERAHIGTYIGMYISSTAPTGFFFTYTPQIESDSRVEDQTGWTEVSGDYTAVGGEEYITIGNFRTSANLFNNMAISGYDPTPWPSTPDAPLMWSGYYYVDGVSVEAYEGCENSHTENIVVTPGPCLVEIAENCFMPVTGNVGNDHINEVLQSNTIWTGEEHWVGGQLTIPNGVTLEIDNTIMNFGDNAKLVVERGGKLVIRNQSTLKACAPDKFWQGIEVWGHKQMPHTASNQGMLIAENSIIRDAKIAVYAGRRDLASGSNMGMWSGAIVQILNQMKFENNGRSLFFAKYLQPNNLNEISNSSFDLSNPSFNFNEPAIHLEIKPSSRFSISGNVFKGGETGIKMVTQSGVSLDQNKFVSMTRGVLLKGTSQTQITNSQFTDVDLGIKSVDSDNTIIFGNTFINGDRGIKLIREEVFTIESNFFVDQDYPITTNESRGSQLKSKITGNTFDQSIRAIRFKNDDHTNLDITCNNFVNFSEFAIRSNNSVLKNQGTASVGAGNNFQSNSQLNSAFLKHNGNAIVYYYDPSMAQLFNGQNVMTATTIQSQQDQGCEPGAQKKEEIESTIANHDITIYPNPNKGHFTIDLNDYDGEDYSFTITDASGKLVFAKSGNDAQIQLDLGAMERGVYLIRFVFSDSQQNLRFVVQ